MKLCFVLSMPNRNSWNGKWSGEDRLYARVISFNSKKSIEKAKTILDKKSYFYNFGDGWTACVSVKEVSVKDGTSIKRKSKGFCGYDWMVDSIIFDGEIVSSSSKRNNKNV